MTDGTPPMRPARSASEFDGHAERRDAFRRLNRGYYDEVTRLLRSIIPPGSSVLEIGCATGDLLAALEPSEGLGIDISPRMIEIARSKHREPGIRYEVGDAQAVGPGRTFDFVVMSDVVGLIDDVQAAFESVKRCLGRRSRLVVTYYNHLWEPVLAAGERLGIKQPVPRQNWLSAADIGNLLSLAGLDVIRSGRRVLLPAPVPGLSAIANRLLAKVPVLDRLDLVHFCIGRLPEPWGGRPSVTVVIPARNERGNIEEAVRRIPDMGSGVEILFVEGGSDDGTADEIRRVAAAWEGRRRIRHITQSGKGKANAVREAFDVAEGDVLMILDADLTVPPEDLPKFLDALVSGKAEFVNGCRLVYPLEDQAMRLLNLAANKMFGDIFSWIMEQRVKDTLCGTKVISREDYARIAARRDSLGRMDPFGDFDLLFGASTLNLAMVEVPVRYRARTYGETNISRFRHGVMLFRMAWEGSRRLKLSS